MKFIIRIIKAFFNKIKNIFVKKRKTKKKTLIKMTFIHYGKN